MIWSAVSPICQWCPDSSPFHLTTVEVLKCCLKVVRNLMGVNTLKLHSDKTEIFSVQKSHDAVAELPAYSEWGCALSARRGATAGKSS